MRYRKVRMPVDSLKPGTVVYQSVYDRLGRALILPGTPLNEVTISSLQRLGISHIFINGEPIPDWEPDVSPEAQNNIDRLRVSDRAGVKLSDAIKKRIHDGIQYIYSNTEAHDMVKTSTLITDSLMEALNDNHAISIDVNALKTSDEYTFKHSVDVATISMIIAKTMKYDRKRIYDIGVSGLLHDIGKSQIADDILNKPGPLNSMEFEIMKSHPILGYNILRQRKEYSKEICMGVLQHHEKANGQGYPMKLPAGQISDFAKILAVADIYDALITDRPYKKAYSPRVAVEMVISMGEELDMEVMNAFLRSVIVYPVDSFIKLSNGEMARVVRNTPEMPLRPTVVGVQTGMVYQLSRDINCANIVIE